MNNKNISWAITEPPAFPLAGHPSGPAVNEQQQKKGAFIQFIRICRDHVSTRRVAWEIGYIPDIPPLLTSQKLTYIFKA